MEYSFSCLLSCYKGESPIFLEQALQSLVNQSLLPNDVVLVEDGPLTEELNNILNSFENKLPLNRVRLSENIGLGAALNKGLERCKYEFVFRMDTDDVCSKNRFKEQIDFFKDNPEVDILGSWANDIDEVGDFLKLRTVPESDGEIKKYIWTCPIIHPSVAYKKGCINKIGGYDKNLKRRQDYDLWFRAVEAGSVFYNIQKPLLNYRFTDDYYKKD